MGRPLLSLLIRAFFSCDGELGEVWRHVLLLLQCYYVADLTVLAWGTDTVTNRDRWNSGST